MRFAKKLDHALRILNSVSCIIGVSTGIVTL